jgi:hypothetical protein
MLPTEAPKRNDAVRQRTYKTKAETEKSKTVTSTVVLTLLVIACVVPMLRERRGHVDTQAGGGSGCTGRQRLRQQGEAAGRLPLWRPGWGLQLSRCRACTSAHAVLDVAG